MKHLLILISFLYVTSISAQINIGNNQTICLGDAAQLIASTSVQASTDSYQQTNIIYSPELVAGTPISLTDDDVQGPFPIGFSFQFYGNNYSDFYVGSNGWIGFSSGQPTSYSATPIPDSVSISIPRNCIMLTWEDLNPSSGGQVIYQTIGNAPNRKMILTFDNVPYFGSATTAGPITSQVILYEGSNVIDNHVTDKPLHTNPSIQGIHNLLGTRATVVPGRNAVVWSTSNESVRYFPSGVTWFDVNTSQMIGVGDTINYSPTQSTLIAAQIIDSTGQVYSDTIQVNILNTQIAPSGLSLCNGPVTLTAAPNFALYVWNNNSASSQLLVTSPGTYYVNCTSSNGSVCQSPPVTIYADTIPTLLGTTDSIEICQGDTVHITGSPGYSSYIWSTGETTNDIYTTMIGDYSLITLDANGCVGISDTTSISIRILDPDIFADYMTICNGMNGTSIYTNNLYQSYLWNNGNTFSSIYTSNAGDYWVTVTDVGGCSGISDTITIVNGNYNFNLLPSDSLFLCTPNSNVVMDAVNAGTFVQYQWSTGATTPTISTNATGSYYCIVEISIFGGSSCYGFSDTVEVFGINPQLSYSGLSLCAGPVSLNTGNFDMYQWSNSVATQSISVNQAGNYYVFVTDSNGCTAYSDTISIYTNNFQYNINPSGSTTICPGYSVDLDAGIQFTNHLWNTGATSSTITPSTIGQYYASMTDVNGCSGYTDTIAVTNMSVNLSTTGYSLCNPQAYPVLDAGSGYYIYNWSNGDTTSSITASLPGNYHVTVIDQNGCTASSDTITIYLNQFAFDISSVGTDSICQPNGQVTLDAGSGYFSYLWSSGGNSQQTVVNAAGNYTVNVMDMNGCSGTSNPFIVHNIVSTSQVTGLTNVIQNDIENYSVIQNPNSVYSWGVSGGILQSGLGTNSVDILWNNPGMASLYVIETDINGCVGDTINLSVTVFMSTDIQENQDLVVSIYPNPFSKETYLTIDNQDKEYSLSLYDVTGHKIWSKKEITSKSYKISREKLADGIYFLELVTDNNQKLLKLVIN